MRLHVGVAKEPGGNIQNLDLCQPGEMTCATATAVLRLANERGASEGWTPRLSGYALKAGQLTYDCRYSTMHGMPVTGGRGFRGLKLLWYNGVPP